MRLKGISLKIILKLNPGLCNAGIFVFLRKNKMTLANRNIVNAYSKMLEGLDLSTKSRILEVLNTSIKQASAEKTANEFLRAFGAWESERPDEDIINGVRSSKIFREKDFRL